MGVGSIPTMHSGYTRPTAVSLEAVSLGSVSEMIVGIKNNKEVRMKTGKKTLKTSVTVKLAVKTRVLASLIVGVLIVGGMLGAPLARAQVNFQPTVFCPD